MKKLSFLFILTIFIAFSACSESIEKLESLNKKVVDKNLQVSILDAKNDKHNNELVQPTPPITHIPTLTSTPTPKMSPTPILQEKEITVYVTKTGEKYHRSGCRYLSKSKIPIDLKSAKINYSPCSVCNPPK